MMVPGRTKLVPGGMSRDSFNRGPAWQQRRIVFQANSRGGSLDSGDCEDQRRRASSARTEMLLVGQRAGEFYPFRGSLARSSGGVMTGRRFSANRRERLTVLSGTGRSGAASREEPVLYPQRWIQLALLAVLALISDLVCFSVAATPDSWVDIFNHNPANLIDVFLFTNVASCFLVTDVTRIFGLRKAVVGAAFLMSCGCLLRSGIPMVGELPSYSLEVAGTILVGAAQPFFQCTPPLLSATWFGAEERALATAVAINFNQVPPSAWLFALT